MTANPSLYHRAADRCEANILRVWPAWRQAHITDETRSEFEAWRAVNVAHLQDLRDDIVKGGAPDIDRGWPDSEPTPTLEQTEAPNDPPDLAERLEAMEAAKTKLDARPDAPAYSPPPPEIADLLRVSETYEQTNERLLPLFRDAKNRAEMAIDGEDKTERMKWEAKAERLQSAINWNRGRAVETIG